MKCQASPRIFLTMVYKHFRFVPTGQDTIAQDGVERRRNAILGRGEESPSALKGRGNLSRPFRAGGLFGAFPGVALSLHPRLSYPVPLGRKSEATFLAYCLFTALIIPVLTNAQTAPLPSSPPPPPTTTSISMAPTTPPGTAWTGKHGALTGRVISDDGQPFASIGVNVTSAVAERSARRMTMTDEEGNFKLNDLPAGAYSISPSAPGYVNPNSSFSDGTMPARASLYRLGESPTITMSKGGVITGKAMDSTGQPLVGAVVNAVRVRDGEGRNAAASFSARGLTDDRGIYRIFGLQSGSYLVSTDGGGETSSSAREVATYYPHGTRDTAQEVAVTTGGEVQGIDIRHRGELGRVVSGTVTGYTESRTVFSVGVTVELLHATTGVRVASANLSTASGNGFAVYGVPDGEYDAVAYQQGFATDGDANRGLSAPRRVTVKGNDVTGLELRLLGLSSIAGRVVVEKLDLTVTCPIKRSGGLEETLIAARRDEKEARPSRFTWADALADEKGDFGLRSLVAGLYRVNPQLPSEHWYVKAMSLSGTAPAKAPAPKTAPVKAANAVTGVTVKSNEKLSGLTITLAEGAAGLSGRLEGQKLAPRMRVHLVPAEKDTADEILRYAEAVTRDGAFVFAHLAPGKYWIVARAVPDDESDEKPAKPVAWQQQVQEYSD